MRITNLRSTPIALGDPPLLNAAGLHAPFALRIVIELETDAGITGLCEIPGDIRTFTLLEEAKRSVVGLDPKNQSQITHAVEKKFSGTETQGRGEQSWDGRALVHIVSALEVACLDIVGKHTGMRVVDLLGGAVRERVPYCAYLFFKYEGAGGTRAFSIEPNKKGWVGARQEEALTPEALVAQAKAMVSAFGFKSLKLKAGILEPDVEVATVFALRETFGPSVPIRIDPNAAWSFETAKKYGERMKGVIEYYEDPVRGQSEMARLRKEIDIPFATNMCTTSFDELPTAIALGSEDIILADHHFWGGLRASLELARICKVFGRSLSMHSNSHAGISLAAMTHLGAALPELPYALDTHYPWQEDEIIVGGKLAIKDGFVELPKGPGLGVELDREALGRAHEQYLASGLLRRNDEIEMQKRQPGWVFKKTRY
jgi:glucarate dehydratase